MIELTRCPVCASDTRLLCVGRSQNAFVDAPGNIQQAGVNAVLSFVVKRDRLAVSTIMCATCRHFYLTPTFDEGEIGRFYSDEMATVTREQYRKSVAVSGLSWAEQHGIRAERQAELRQEEREVRPRLLRDFVVAHAEGRAKAPAKIIDVGGMDGAMMGGFPNADRYVFDTNPRPEGAGDAKFLGSEAQIGATGKFDLLIMSHVLEHQPEPARFLGRHLADVETGGGVYLEVPLEYQSAYVRRRGFPIGGHVNFFTASSLARLARDAGLRVLKVQRGIFPYGEMRIPILKLFAEKTPAGSEGGRRPRAPFLGELAYDLGLLMKHRYVRGH